MGNRNIPPAASNANVKGVNKRLPATLATLRPFLVVI